MTCDVGTFRRVVDEGWFEGKWSRLVPMPNHPPLTPWIVRRELGCPAARLCVVSQVDRFSLVGMGVGAHGRCHRCRQCGLMSSAAELTYSRYEQNVTTIELMSGSIPSQFDDEQASWAGR